MAYESKAIRIFQELNTDKMDKDAAILKAMNEHKLTRMTATNYYYQWKKAFMPGSKCVPKEEEEEIKKAVKRDLRGAEMKVNEKSNIEPVTPEKVEEIKTTFNKLNEPELPEHIDLIEEKQIKEEQKVELDEPKKGIIFTPVVLMGEIFEYRFNTDGVTITNGQCNILSRKCIDEQKAAMDVWDQYYGKKSLREQLSHLSFMAPI